MRNHEPVCVVHAAPDPLRLPALEQHVRVVYAARDAPLPACGNPVILLGHATAAPSALRTALAHPGRLAGLILYSPSPDGEDVSALTLPTLIITGAHDPICGPSRAALLHGRIRGSALLVLPEGDSVAPLTQTAAFVGAVSEFIDLVTDPV
ncbi:hypothetical protein Ade02nite_61680 [Paractinoplanes deccanensis]|uniref:Alpha/beta hydrolase n=1 Tax=Paractinoplanes deccanensis TaxID=113561 RepID=A0ABQ3YBZ2_9ACTN|nr:hypothetical protein [Actinoplanes deccanensis]GID77527.1 hypothetical protein Ade02nite_61680 [Actinoplanes deccanensis]